MQTAKEKTAEGLVRSEVQDMCKYYLSQIMEEHVQKLCRENEEFKRVHDEMAEHFKAAFKALKDGKWDGPPSANKRMFKPTRRVYLFSWDNCKSHSFYVDTKQKQMDFFGIPLLQMIQLCPNGHDIHQCPEHAIGVLKSEASKIIHEHPMGVPDTQVIYQALQDVVDGKGGEEVCKFGPETMYSQMNRLRNCLKVVSTPRDEWVELDMESCCKTKGVTQRKVRVQGTGGNYAYMNLA